MAKTKRRNSQNNDLQYNKLKIEQRELH